MRKASFLIGTLILVSILSSCGGWNLISDLIVSTFKFCNRSSYVVAVQITESADRGVFTLEPGDTKTANSAGYQEDLGYTYTPSDVVETGKDVEDDNWRITTYYYFWDSGSPRPY